MELLEPWIPHLAALGGILTGIAITWFVCRGKALADQARHQERCRSAEKAIADLEAACANLDTEVRQLRHTEAVSLKRQAELEVLAKHQAKAVEEKQQLLREAELRLASHFKALSTETLRSTQDEFLKLARATFDTQQREVTSELEQRRVAVETLVRPVADTLSKVESRIGELERARKDSETALTDQVRQMAAAQMGLQKETAQLARALRQPAGRGRWGEIQLKRVVELSGMQPYCDFIRTGGERSDDGQRRPDLVVNLPGGRQIAVDARAPLEACLEAAEAPDEETRAAALKKHGRQLAAHLAELASATYRGQFLKAPEFVVLFLPSESFLSAALAEEPSLMERGIEKGVILATPTTLVALLRAAAVGWRQEGVAEKARTVSEVGRELFSRATVLADHVSRVGQSLDATVQNYNRALGSLEGDVLASARKLSEFGGSPQTDKLSAPPAIEHTVRQPRTELSALPLAGRLSSALATTGEMPDDGFEGFAAPVPAPAPKAAKPDSAKRAPAEAPVAKETSAPNRPKATVRPADKPDAGAAARDLRAALASQRKAV